MNESPITCPKCGVVNVPSAKLCDCGNDLSPRDEVLENIELMFARRSSIARVAPWIASTAVFTYIVGLLLQHEILTALGLTGLWFFTALITVNAVQSRNTSLFVILLKGNLAAKLAILGFGFVTLIFLRLAVGLLLE